MQPHRERRHHGPSSDVAGDLLARIDEALGDPVGETGPSLEERRLREADKLARKLRLRTPPPAGRILHPDAPNMGPQPYRLDHWDAYVCRFDDPADDPAGDPVQQPDSDLSA